LPRREVYTEQSECAPRNDGKIECEGDVVEKNYSD